MRDAEIAHIFLLPYTYIHQTMKRLLIPVAAIALAAAPASAKDRITHNPDATNTDVILHAWSWNFPSIAENMARIADAGYTEVCTIV